MHHHNEPFIKTLEADRRARGARRRPPSQVAELDHMLEAASQGDPGAWSALVDRFTARVLGVTRRHRLAPHDAEDIVQTTWLRLLEHAGNLREPAAVGAWLETTARHESLRLLRAARRELAADEEELSRQPVWEDAERDVITGQTRAAIKTALGELPGRQRQLLRMLFADDEPTYEHIARTLDMPIGSIGPTRARGLDRLRGHHAVLAAVGDSRG
jgi:RNA polymerase sigma factor (sigma-70 family)